MEGEGEARGTPCCTGAGYRIPAMTPGRVLPSSGAKPCLVRAWLGAPGIIRDPVAGRFRMAGRMGSAGLPHGLRGTRDRPPNEGRLPVCGPLPWVDEAYSP